MKIFKRVALALLLVLVGIQFIPTTRNQSDEVLETDFIETFGAPDPVATLLRVSCYDCHSNNTAYPWYNKVQPASWLLEWHIGGAKEELDFSEFGGYSKRKQKSKLKSIISQIKDDEMPLFSYTLMHRDARLSENDKSLLVNWMTELRDGL